MKTRKTQAPKPMTAETNILLGKDIVEGRHEGIGQGLLSATGAGVVMVVMLIQR